MLNFTVFYSIHFDKGKILFKQKKPFSTLNCFKRGKRAIHNCDQILNSEF